MNSIYARYKLSFKKCVWGEASEIWGKARFECAILKQGQEVKVEGKYKIEPNIYLTKE